MEYSITIAGTIEDEAEGVEDTLLEEAQTFVGELEGVTSATFNSPGFANVDLTEVEEEEGEE